MIFSNHISRISFLFLVLLSSCVADYYKILGVKRSSTTKEIKKAYRALSLQFHPDKNKDEGAAEKFSEINDAYEILSDDELKDIYDQHGDEGIKRHRGGGGGGATSFDDIFSHFGFGGGGRQQREQKTPSVEMSLRLSLKQLYVGATLDVEFVRQALCMHWQDCMKNSQECQGPGIKVKMQQIAPGFVQQVQTRDDKCVARGKMWRPNCRDCPNGKTEPEKLVLTIDVVKGMRNGEQITFEGVADEQPGMPTGDLVFEIVQLGDTFFHREGDQLYITMEIPLVDALVGFKREITHLDGHKFTIEVSTVTECDHTIRIASKGMPRRSGRGYGDLFITFDVDFPETITDLQKQQIKSIFGAEQSSDEL